jgi:hypothetical protein
VRRELKTNRTYGLSLSRFYFWRPLTGVTIGYYPTGRKPHLPAREPQPRRPARHRPRERRWARRTRRPGGRGGRRGLGTGAAGGRAGCRWQHERCQVRSRRHWAAAVAGPRLAMRPRWEQPLTERAPSPV